MEKLKEKEAYLKEIRDKFKDSVDDLFNALELISNNFENKKENNKEG